MIRGEGGASLVQEMSCKAWMRIRQLLILCQDMSRASLCSNAATPPKLPDMSTEEFATS